MTGSAEWIDRMRASRAVDVALAIGMTEIGRAPGAWCVGPCPACDAERRHTRSADKRGAIGVPKGDAARGWKCWQCDATGDGIDLVAYALRRTRYRDLQDAGRAEVRQWCERWLGIDQSAPATQRPIVRAVASPAAPATYPSADELSAVWSECVRADEDDDVRTYLDSRRIDPRQVADYDLARALPAHADVPAWAHRWRAQHRLIVPLYDATATMRSVLARAIAPAERKSLAPSGFRRGGLTMMDAFARLIVRDGVPDWWPELATLKIQIGEGEIDYLTLAVMWSDSAVCAPATIGITQGAWTPELAARIPARARVLVSTHADEPGEKYARQIYHSLRARNVATLRCRPRL